LILPRAGSWWTGKDSNLRSPQGAADLQSAGFSHSPTRPRKSVDTCAQSSWRRSKLCAEATTSEKHKTDSCLKTPALSCYHVGIRSALTPLVQIWWSWRRELNPRPSDYKSDALPAELRQRRSNRTRITDWTRLLQEMDSKLLGGKREATVEKCPLSVHP
jgi:hypothetical protein